MSKTKLEMSRTTKNVKSKMGISKCVEMCNKLSRQEESTFIQGV